MGSNWIKLLCLLTVVALGAVNCETSIEPPFDDEPLRFQSRIVNGTKALVAQFPYQVSLRRSWSDSHFCGGSLISDKWVLGAGHCMFHNKIQIQPWTIKVVAGELNLKKKDPNGQRSVVSNLIVHPYFDLYTLQNDVALLLLKTPFKMTKYVYSAPLRTTSVIPGVSCRVAGWGYPAFNITKVTDDLQYVNLPILSIGTCRKLLKNVTNVPPGMYCAGYLEGGKDACQGDSGGGMICNGVLSGVVSGGEGCAWPKLPGLYADVQYYRKWIFDRMRDTHYKNGNGRISNNSTNGTSPKIPNGNNSGSRGNSAVQTRSLISLIFIVNVICLIVLSQ